MRRLISVIFILMLVFTGCGKEDIVKYDLVLYDDNLSGIGEYLVSAYDRNGNTVEFKITVK